MKHDNCLKRETRPAVFEKLSQDNDLRIRWQGMTILDSVLCRDDYKRNHPCIVQKWRRAAGARKASP